MKSYKNFQRFIHNPEYLGTEWNYVKQEAVKYGFKLWQVNLYSWWYHKSFHFTKLKILIRKVLKFLWYVFVCFGLLILTWDLTDLIKSTTKKNDVITLSYIARTCTDYPSLCNRIADKGGYTLKKQSKGVEK